MKSDFLDAAFASKVLDARKVRAATERTMKAKRIHRQKEENNQLPTKAEVEKRLADEESRAREKGDHEISNAELDRGRMHRKERGEKFVSLCREKASGSITRKRLVRTEHDARLVEALGDDRMDAMELIATAFHMETAGLGMRTSDPLRIPGGYVDADAVPRLVSVYWIWAVEVQRRGLDHSACIDVAVYFRSPSSVDRWRRRRNGGTLENLKQCLDLSIEMGILLCRRKGE